MRDVNIVMIGALLGTYTLAGTVWGLLNLMGQDTTEVSPLLFGACFFATIFSGIVWTIVKIIGDK